MNCPNCTHKLKKNPKHAENVWSCPYCRGVFHIVVTTRPLNLDEILHRKQIEQAEMKLKQWKIGS